MALAPASHNNKPGRRPNTDANAQKLAALSSTDRKFEFRASQKDPESVLRLREGASLAEMDKSEFARQAIGAAYERVKAGQPIGGEIDWANIGTDSFRAPRVSRLNCGPWRAAVEGASPFTINGETADELEAKEGDVWAPMEGDSMKEAGIQDGFLVLVRPYGSKSPRRGEIVWVEVTTGTEESPDEPVSTIKRFDGFESGTGLPRLLDGRNEDYPLPDDVLKAEIVARGIATMGRL